MELAVIMFVVSLSVTHVAGNTCNETHNASLCSVTAGASVFIRLMTNASGHEVLCRKQLPQGLVPVFTLKREKMTVQYEPLRNRTHFFINNGTFKISNTERNDSGHYIIEAYDPNGMLVRNIDVHLDVQEDHLSLLILIAAGAGALCLLLLLIYVCFSIHRRKKGSGSVV